MIDNPFNVTKSDDFTDEEICRYWVDVPGAGGIERLVKPTSPMPVVILGGKGSGKTHLLRYCSYALQKIRHADDVVTGIREDGYLGVYVRCGGLNTTRFRDKRVGDEAWSAAFAYYTELWLGQLLVTYVSELLQISKTPFSEDQLASKIINCFDKLPASPPTTLKGILQLLARLQRDSDKAINEAAFSNKLAVDINITPGRLLFGIPHAIVTNVPILERIKFLYLFDEFENLSENQQSYVNTLVRYRQSPTSIRIGARLYGMKTYRSLAADEVNKEGSEFETVQLDFLETMKGAYSKFAARILVKRLEQSSFPTSELKNPLSIMRSAFEELPKGRFERAQAAKLMARFKPRERPHIEAFKRFFVEAATRDLADGIHSKAEAKKIVDLLGVPEYPLLEKLNLLLFYRAWRAKENLSEAAERIVGDCRALIKTGKSSRLYKTTLGHFTSDLMAQLYREAKEPIPYVGFDTFVKMSSFVPRNLLTILKRIYGWAQYNGERPFQGVPVSVDAQMRGVQEAAEWFYEDARPDAGGRVVQECVGRLATLLREIRFSEKPSECSVSSFSVNLNDVKPSAQDLLQLAINWSWLLPVPNQKDRNSKRLDNKYQLNGMLAPKWGLPVSRRGTLSLSAEEFEAIFGGTASADAFAHVLKERIDRMTPPFRSTPDQESVRVHPQLFS